MLFIVLGLNIAFWYGSQKIYARWEGVPPPPSKRGAALMGLGDHEFAYRFLALNLQNLGDVGRDVTPLKNYDYQRIGQWLFLLHSLDPISDHVPSIAAYYFGGTRVPKDSAVIANFLGVIGQVPLGEKWKWLAHAVYLEQHRVHNFDRALQLAYKLSKMADNGVKMPYWARQMPIFVLSNRGEKQAALHMMQSILATQEYIDPFELDHMKSYMVDELGMDSEQVDSLIRMRGEQNKKQ